MEERKMEDLMIDYVEGNLKGELRDHVERTIKKSEKWKIEFSRLSKILNLMDTSEDLKPDQSLKENFDRMLTNEIENENKEAKQIRLTTHSNSWFLRVAASVSILILGAVIVFLITKNQQNERELLVLKSEMELTRKLVISSLQNQSVCK